MKAAMHPHCPLTVLGLALAPRASPGRRVLPAGHGTGQTHGVDAIIFMKRAVQRVDSADQTKVTIDVVRRQRPGHRLRALRAGRQLEHALAAAARRHADRTSRTRTSRPPTSTASTCRSTRQQAVFSMKKDGNDHYHIYTVQLTRRRGRQVRDSPEDGRRLRRHQPDLHRRAAASRSRRTRCTRQMGTRADEYEHSPRRHAARERSRSTAATPIAASSRRTSRTSSRRSSASTARSATRAGSTSAASTT